jgi:hypothetical protein
MRFRLVKALLESNSTTSSIIVLCYEKKLVAPYILRAATFIIEESSYTYDKFPILLQF